MTRWRVTLLIFSFVGMVLGLGLASGAWAECGGGGGDGTIVLTLNKAGVYKRLGYDVEYHKCQVQAHIDPAVSGHSIRFTCEEGQLWVPGENGGWQDPPVTITTNEGGNAVTFYLAPPYWTYDVITAKDLTAPNQPEDSEGIPVFEITIVMDDQEHELRDGWEVLFYFGQRWDETYQDWMPVDPRPRAYPVHCWLRSYPSAGIAPQTRAWCVIAGSDSAAFRPWYSPEWYSYMEGVEVPMESRRASPEQDDVDLTFSYGSTLVYRWQTEVLRPSSIELRALTDEPYGSPGYLTNYVYAVLDQFGLWFPSRDTLPFCESWWTLHVSDPTYPDENWPMAFPTGWNNYPDAFNDRMAKWEPPQWNPHPQYPHGGNTKVDHWGQDLWCGSTDPEENYNHLSRHTFQRYQDHGRHDNPI